MNYNIYIYTKTIFYEFQQSELLINMYIGQIYLVGIHEFQFAKN